MRRPAVTTLVITSLCLMVVARAWGQSAAATASKSQELSSEDAREIWDTGFLKKRPAHSGGHSQTPHYAAETHKAAAKALEAKPSKAAIGLTVWRLRAPVAAEHDDSRLLLQDKGERSGVVVLIPERLDATEPLREGDRVRLSIEVPRVGFLYVIDREKYRDGLLGAPMLIYPTLNMNGGKNDVAPGLVIEIPPRDSEVVALKINRSSDRQTGEDLTFIVSAQPLLEITLTDGMQALPPALVAWVGG